MTEQADSLTHVCEQCSHPRVRLAGSVAGVAACELVTEKDSIVIGSALDNDLVVIDPLVPLRALSLRHVKLHAGSRDTCRSYWQLTAGAGVRVFVNNQLITRCRLVPGDTFAMGCHQFVFEDAQDVPRDRRLNVNVADLCAKLIAARNVPVAYLHGLPGHRDRLRSRAAMKWSTIAAMVLLVLMLILRPSTEFEQVQPPMEIVMMAEVARTPDPDAVRSMEQVDRQTFEQPSAGDPAAPLQQQQPTLDEVVARPLLTQADIPVQAPQQVEFTPVALTEPLDAPPLPVPVVSAPVSMTRPTETLTRSTPARRLSTTEATNVLVQATLNVPTPTFDNAAFANTAPAKINAAAPAPAPRVDATAIDTGQDKRLANLEQIASPVDYEELLGQKVPVARMAQTLEAMDVPGKDEMMVADGKVSKEEIAASWKSGQFNLHGPNPRPVEPKTFCYVSKTKKDGKDYLYISFVCMDPNTNQIITGNSNALWKDDSVEVFLDVNNDRRDYFHLIVNAKGQVQAKYCANGQQGIDNTGAPWNSGAIVQTTINPTAQQWEAEILIPFDRLGGVPAEGSRWAVNFTRAFRGQGGPGSVYQNWFLVYKDGTNYHHPELYGVFQW
jgi:hypothetical protein